MKRCVIKFEYSGICTIHMGKAIKYFNKNCRIYVKNEIYTVCEYTPVTRKRKFRIEISKYDADFIIKSLKLKKAESNLFKNACVYSL